MRLGGAASALASPKRLALGNRRRSMAVHSLSKAYVNSLRLWPPTRRTGNPIAGTRREEYYNVRESTRKVCASRVQLPSAGRREILQHILQNRRRYDRDILPLLTSPLRFSASCL